MQNEMESQNCWEPVINEKEKVINDFVEVALTSLEERLMRTAEGVSDEYGSADLVGWYVHANQE